MPLLTDPYYVSNHDLLRSHRLRGDAVFILLSNSEQQALFAYYRHHERCSRKALLEHRRLVTKEHQSLPHRAGRALRRWHHLREHPMPPKPIVEPRPRGRPSGSSNFELAFQMRPDPDAKQVARAITQLAEFVNQQQDAREDPGSAPLEPSDDSQSSGH